MKKKSFGFLTARLFLIAAFFLLLLAGCSSSLFRDKDDGLVTDNINWPVFMSRQDPVWEELPDNFDEGAFLGNGMMGAMIYRQSENQLRWEMGRADVTEHRRDNHRLPIGGLVLETAGIIQGGTIRLDLWNAEVLGQILTDKGSISFRTLIHTEKMAMILDLETAGEETAAIFKWDPGHGQDPRNQRPGKPPRFDDPLNPPAFTEQVNKIPVCIQPRYSGGEFATAWKEVNTKPGRRVFLSIADSYPGNTARSEAVNTVIETADADFGKLESSHRDWWHKLYPQSLISVPDPKLESFYWIQIYKLGSASRPDHMPVDLLGPWYRDTGWPRIWWNLNIQTLYLPVYTANQLMLGESFIRLIDEKRDNFVKNAKDIWGVENAATVSHTTCYEGLRGDGSSAPDRYLNPGDFTWALHNYYLHYRHSMDHSMITDHKKHAFYPLLKGSVNLYFHLLKEGEDGKLHLPELHSPEYGADEDNNYNLSLLRWALKTLIELNERYELNDPLLLKWKETLENLTDYPVDENGFRIGSGISFTKSHRHWSHLLMVHPLQIMDFNDPESRELTIRSIRHWLTVDEGRQVYGWSRAAAASLYAILGEGDNAIAQIHGHMADKRFVRPNTMYIEGDPVIECSVILGRSLQDMLLQSHNNLIRIFPAVPSNWDNAIFHNLLTEGAFLVSSARKNGVTQWVRIKSLAGEPCLVNPGFTGKIKATVPFKDNGNGIYELNLSMGKEALLYTGSEPPVPVVEPVAADPAQANFWGVK